MERKVFDSQTWPLRREYITNGDYELQRSTLQHWNRTILDINDRLIHSGLGGLTYTDQSREIEEIIDAVYALEQYMWDVEDRFQELDTQFYELINVPLQQLNNIRLEDITIANPTGIRTAGIGQGQSTAPKERISLLDLLNTEDGQIGTYYVKAFADAFQNKYDRGRINERCATIEEFAEHFWELDDLQNYVNEAEKQAKVQKAKRIGANIATLSLYSLVEVLYGYDFIAQRELSYEEVRDRAFPALLSVSFNGMAAGQLLKSGLGGLEMVGSMYATEATSTLSGVASYEIAQELGFSDKGSTAAALISSMLTTNLVSYGMGKILSEKTSGIDVSKAEIRSNLFKVTGELRTAEEISVYLKSLTEAEFASVVRQVNKKTLNEIKALDGLADEVVVKFGGKGATKGSSSTIKRTQAEVDALATDPAIGNRITPKTIAEREVGLGIESQGKVSQLVRDSSGSAEFIDSVTGQKWDVKAFNSNYAPKGYNLSDAMKNIEKSIANGENVMLDTRNLNSTHLNELMSEIVNRGLDGNVIKWP